MLPRNIEIESRISNPRLAIQAVLLLGLIGLGIASRFILFDWPNFKPIFAIAIFSGFLFSTRWPVLLAIAGMLLVSDALIGFYEIPVMIAVYGSLLAALWLGRVLKRCVQGQSTCATTTGIIAASLAASTLFFVTTNAAVWLAGWYPPTATGLLDSFLAGIPFFKFTVAGDLCFSLLLFACWFAAASLLARRVVSTREHHEMSSTASPSTSNLG